MKTPAQDQAVRARCGALLDNIADYVTAHARTRGHDPALVEHNTGDVVSWRELDRAVDALAAKLLASGFGKGDVLATSLPLLKEHVFLQLACYRVGVVFAPLDLRLRAGELRACLEKLQPRGYFYAGAPALLPVLREVVGTVPCVRHWVQFQKEAAGILPGAVWVREFTRDVKRRYLASLLTGAVRRARRRVGRRDGCLVIFTTGSTGSPKPALLCHEGILAQNAALVVGFDLRRDDRLLVNLPPSHVGCATEILGTGLYEGVTSVLLHIFDAEKSLEAIARHRVTVLGQIPAMLNMQWKHSRYPAFDLSSLRLAIYGGQGPTPGFLEKLRAMAPGIGTGLGLTEASGFCTYTALDAGAEDLAASIGYDAPTCPITIREPMRPDGAAGAEKPRGEVGHVCFSGPQLFLGYVGSPAATAAAISRDGVLYTGDLGAYGEEGLKLAGRSGLTIKPKGFQVFPGDVENHVLARLQGAATSAACVGAEHAVWGEAIVLFVERAPDRALTAEAVAAASEGIASYMRPSHVELLEPGTLPLNRVAKTDYMVLRERARELVETLRARGGWDARG
jgi:acyl-CoA synthetase (AMP-forming)/AMP-acid ligase II